MSYRVKILSLIVGLMAWVAPTVTQGQVDAPQQVPNSLLGIHNIFLMDSGELYVFAEVPIGYADETPDGDFALRVDFQKLFPTPASFDAFDNSSEIAKQTQMWDAMAYVSWDTLKIDKDDILARGTVLLDLNETNYGVLQSDFEDHIGAMAQAWNTALSNPFSAGSEPLDVTALLHSGDLQTLETWGFVGRWVSAAASAVWSAGKWVAGKALPVAQAVELCATAGNMAISSVVAGEWPAGEDWIELCFDAGECIPYAGVAVAVAHEAYCVWDYD